MSARAYDILLGFLVTSAFGVGVSALVIRLYYRYVVGACVTDWTLAVILGLVVGAAATALEALLVRGDSVAARL